MSTKPRLIWGSNSEFFKDFDNHFTTLETPIQNTVAENVSDSGIVETLSFFDRQIIRASRKFQRPQDIAELLRWYEYAKDGSQFSLYIDRDLVGIWNFENANLYSNNLDQFTFAHTGTKYFINPDTGLVDAAGEDVACFPGGIYGRGIQMETQLTNILTNTQEFDNANWIKLGGATVTANNTDFDDPRGGSTSDKLTFSGDGSGVQQQTATSISSNDANFSVWIKAYEYAASSIKIEIIRDDTSAVIATETISPTAEWVRYSVSYENTGSIVADFDVQIVRNGAGTDSVLVWGAQLTVTRFRGLYRTTGSVADSATIDMTADRFLGLRTKGTLGLWFKMPLDSDEMPSARTFVYAEDGSSNIVFQLGLGSSNELEFRINQPGSGTLAEDVANFNVFAADTWYHCVVTWDLVDDLEINMYTSGEIADTETVNYSFSMGPLDSFNLGHDTAGEPFSVCLDELFLRTDVLSAECIAQLYTVDRAMRSTRTYWSQLKMIDYSHNPIRNLGAGWYDFELKAKEDIT